MLRLPFRLAALLCVLVLTAAACSSAAEETLDASANGGDSTAETADGGDGTAETAEPAALGEQAADVAVVGDALPEMPAQIPVTQADNDPAIGTIAPDVTGTSFDGTPVSITADGTPRVIMFVAHWCPHCQREIPAVKALIDDGALPDGVEIVVVSTVVREGEANFPPQRWLESEAWPTPIMRDSAEFDALLAFGAGGFPYTVYLDSEHRVVARSAGELPEDVIRQVWLATADA